MQEIETHPGTGAMSQTSEVAAFAGQIMADAIMVCWHHCLPFSIHAWHVDTRRGHQIAANQNVGLAQAMMLSTAILTNVCLAERSYSDEEAGKSACMAQAVNACGRTQNTG